MKNLLIGLFVLGLTNLGSAQSTQVEFLNPQMESNNILAFNEDTNAPTFKKSAPAIAAEASYLSIVKEETVSKHVSDLEDKVSRFDVTELSKFDGRSESFKIVFKGQKGSITATYDRNGKILTTSERFQDIKLPVPVRQTLFREFPNCSVNKITYLVSYNSNKDVKKVYKIKIEKDNLKRTVLISSEGHIN